jgi:hypothetical protein
VNNDDGPVPRRRTRVLIGIVLVAATLIAPISQLRLGSTEGLFRHVGYGLLFAAPMAGFGLARIVGGHFRSVQIGIAVWVAVLVIGVQQAQADRASWPNSGLLTAALSAYEHPGDHTYVDIDTAEIYYLKDWDSQQNWTSGYSFSYRSSSGTNLYGYLAYRQAVRDGYFNVIAYNKYPLSGVATADAAISAAVKANSQYRLAAVIPLNNRLGVYYVWLKRR